MQFKVDLKSGKKLKLNLTRFTNDLMFELAVNLNSTDIALIKEKQCKNCGTKNNQLIKTWCCEEFLCLHCISGIQVKNGKCMLCKKYLYRNKTQFQHLVKRLCLIHWKGDRIGMEIRGNKGILENEIKKLIMPSKQIKENMLEKEAVRIIGNIEMELKVEKKEKICEKLSIFNNRNKQLIYVANIGFQAGIIVNFGAGWFSSSKCAITNNFLSLSSMGADYYFINSQNAILKKIFDHTEQKNIFCEEIDKISLSWENLFLVWYFQGNYLYHGENEIESLNPHIMFYFFAYSLPIHWMLLITLHFLEFLLEQITKISIVCKS